MTTAQKLFDAAAGPQKITQESEIIRPMFVALGFGRYRLIREYTYDDEVLGFSIILPEGFECDLASAPRPYRSDDFSVLAPAIHDALYRRRGVLDDGRVLWRKECDQVFYRIMRAEGVGLIRARVAYLAVRAFGWVAWRGHA